mgnify:CR=1 FL=1|jgi:hypothetical protein
MSFQQLHKTQARTGTREASTAVGIGRNNKGATSIRLPKNIATFLGSRVNIMLGRGDDKGIMHLVGHDEGELLVTTTKKGKAFYVSIGKTMYYTGEGRIPMKNISYFARAEDRTLTLTLPEWFV